MYEYNARIVAVHDGDTVLMDIDLGFYAWLQHRPVRLEGINAPELGTVKAPNQPGLDATNYLLGLLGRDRFAATRGQGTFGNFGDYALLAGASCPVVVRTRLASSVDFEKYGRVLGYIYLPGQPTTDRTTSVNDAMLAAGQAVPDGA